jgi:hypothetical protein
MLAASQESAFHPRAQRNAFRRRGVRWQSRLFVRENPRLKPSPGSNRVFEIVSDDFPILHLELCSRHCLLFKTSPNDSEQHAGNDRSPSQEGFMKINLAYRHQLCRAGRVFPL